jgi:hypothetical protein
MKRAFLLLLPATLLFVLAMSGCNDESEPEFTRVRVYPECGVAPLQVEGLAIVSGGNESGDPTGGNNNLEIRWSFGDGGTSQTSIAYHTYTEPDDYVVTVTATDPDGKTAEATYPVTVLADSLVIQALSNFPDGAVTTADTVHFDVWASACDINPDVEGDYVKMTYRWLIEDNEYLGRQPEYQFSAAGDYDVQLAVTYPELAVVRRATLSFTVSDPAP